MEKNEIMYKIQGYKEKMLKMQLLLNKIEKNQEYKNEEKFGFYKPMIDDAMDSLELSIISCEANLERLQELIESDEWISGEAGYGAELEELKHGEKYIKPKVKRVKELIEKSISEGDLYEEIKWI